MKLSRIAIGVALSLSLTACFSFFPRTSPSTPSDVVVKENRSAQNNAKTFHLYVGSTHKPVASKKSSKKKAPATQATEEIKSGDVTYYTTGAIASMEDVRNAFVAKTVSDQPALGIRLSDAANKRLSAALAHHRSNTVLASLNNSVFSKIDNAGAKLQDGVLLLPMATLNQAREVADILRQAKASK
ncbi:hypothetical protein [Pelistega ratti]|uniref:hypothetical protein n=1 Tax=Pelistega ratti TaxID=2652177 RepID=UPI00135BCB3D|nr:hypothetical protein [Pelistega ratti]